MATKKLSKKLTKEELREDRVATAVSQWAQWAQKNLRLLIGAVIAVAIVVIAVVAVMQTRARNERNASFAFYRAQEAYMGGNHAQALTEFQGIASQYGSSSSAETVQLYIGNCQLALGNPTAAETAFREFLSDAGSDPLFKSAAIRGLAGALLDQDKAGEAAQEYQRAAEIEGNLMATDDWISAARVLLGQGNKAEARTILERVVRDDPTHPRVQEARVLLEEARAEAS